MRGESECQQWCSAYADLIKYCNCFPIGIREAAGRGLIVVLCLLKDTFCGTGLILDHVIMDRLYHRCCVITQTSHKMGNGGPMSYKRRSSSGNIKTPFSTHLWLQHSNSFWDIAQNISIWGIISSGVISLPFKKDKVYNLFIRSIHLLAINEHIASGFYKQILS